VRGKLDDDFFIWLGTMHARGSFTLDQNDPTSTSVTCPWCYFLEWIYAAAALTMSGMAKSIHKHPLRMGLRSSW
jgi:hypothetical protein